MIVFRNSCVSFSFDEDCGNLLGIGSIWGSEDFNNCVWQVDTGKAVLTAQDFPRFSYEQTEKFLTLRWEKEEKTVIVTLTKSENEEIYWRIFVDLQNAPIKQVDFPVIRGFNSGADLLMPYQSGLVLKNAVESFFAKNIEIPFWAGRGQGAYINEYPAGFSFQFAAYYNENYGFYLAHKDSEAYIKTYAYSYNEEKNGLDYVVSNYPENAGITTMYYTPYDFLIEMFQGDWRWAARKYRAWAIQQKWCKKLTERVIPEALLTADVWRLNHETLPMGLDFAQYYESSVLLQERLGCKLGQQWYGWNKQTHGYGYPNMVKKEDLENGWQEEVLGWNRKFAEEGVRVMPYINTRLWVYEDPSYKAEGAEKALVLQSPEESSVEPWTEGIHHMTVCPGTTLYQKKTLDVCRMAMGAEFDGVYLDQVGSSYAMQCFDKTHGHPVGGGNWWNNSNHAAFQLVRNLIGENKLIATEACCETYYDIVNMCTNVDYSKRERGFNMFAKTLVTEDVPVLSMIYGDYSLHYYCVATIMDDYQNFEMKFIRTMLWGVLPSFDGGTPEQIQSEYAQRNLDVMKNGIDFFKANRDIFFYGRLADTPDCGCDKMEKTWEVRYGGPCTEIRDTVDAVAWEGPDGKITYFAYNYADYDQRITLGGKTVTAPAHNFVKV